MTAEGGGGPRAVTPIADGWERLERRLTSRLFAAAAVLAGLLLLALGAGMTFFREEWAFIETRSLGDPVDWLRPHNEHWSTLPIILYRLMVETIGIGSYVPYQAAVVLIHLCVASLVFVLVRRRSGPGPGFIAGLLVLLFGAGFENLYWGFQTGFDGSMALGLAAIAVSDGAPSTRRAGTVALLLLLSLMSSGTGLIVCVAVGVDWLLEPRWRQHVPWLAIPAGAYLAWYLGIGRSGLETIRDPFTIAALADVPRFVVGGFGEAGAALTGLGSVGGLALAALVLAGIGVRVRQHRVPGLAIGLVAAITVQYALIGLVRGNLFAGQVDYTRYTYVSGTLLLVAVSSLVGRPRIAVAPRLGPLAVAAGASIVLLAFAFNIALLVGGRALFLERADMTRALLIAGLRRPLPVETDPNRTLVLVPAPRSLERIVTAYGDPRTDSLVPWAVRPVPPDVQAEADRRVRYGAPVPQPEGG